MQNYRKHPTLNLYRRSNFGGLSYSDGQEVEKRLHTVVTGAKDRSTFSRELRAGIVDWPSEYHLSVERHSLLRPLGIRNGDRVLELGCGCGALTRFLGEMGADVLAVEGSSLRAEIAAERCHDLPNVKVINDSILDMDFGGRFEWVLLVGVLEYAPVYSDDPSPTARYLRTAVDRLAPDGNLVVAIENKLGLKYFNNCSEDHLGIPFWGIQGLYGPGQPRTFARSELEQHLRSAGLQDATFYYPFPDYKLPRVILSDAALSDPEFGAVELIASTYARDYLVDTARLFDERLVLREAARNGLLGELSNSFLVVAENKPKKRTGDQFLAAAYAMRRDAQFATQTKLVRRGPEIRVLKEKLTDAPVGRAHEGGIGQVTGETGYVPGSLAIWRLITARARQGGIEPICDALMPWFDFVIAHSDAFRNYAGNGLLQLGRCSIGGEFFDVTPFNLIEGPEGLVSIDQEWQVADVVPLGWVVMRGILWSLSNSPGFEADGVTLRGVLRALCARRQLEVSDSELDQWLRSEAELQSVVAGGEIEHIPLSRPSYRIVSLNQLARERGVALTDLAERKTQLESAIARRDDRLRDIERNAAVAAEDTRVRIAGYEEALASQVSRIHELERGVAARDDRLRDIERNAAAAAEDTRVRIAGYEETLASRGNRILELERGLAARDAALAEAEAAAVRHSADEAALRTSLSAVHASTSWQVTRPLRAVGRLVFRSGTSRTAVTAKPPLRTRLVTRLRYSAVGFPALLAMRALRQRSCAPLRDWRAARLITGSWLFDRAWYVAFNRDVARTGIDPVRHYVAYGAREGRDPGPSFSTRGYLARNPDVAVAGVNPLAHYLKFGRHEGRVGGYRALPVGLRNATSAPSGGFRLKRLVCGAARGLLPVRVVDRFMLRKVAREVIAPSGLFDATWYRARYPDVRDANVDPLWHYLLTGWREGRDPHPLFSTGFYLDQNADVRASGGNPLVHYLLYGRDEQRQPNRKGGEARVPPRDVAPPGSSVLPAAAARQPAPAEQREWTQDHFVSPPSRSLDYVADRYGVELLPRYRDLFDVVDRYGSGAAEFEAGAGRALLARAQAAAGETAARQSGADPVASIIIPMFDNVLVTLACIVSVLETGHRTPLEIIVADDQSADPAAAVMGAIGDLVRHLRHPSNLGFLRNCNEAARQARGDFLVFLNNDTLVLPGWLDALVDVLADDPKIGLVGSKLLNGDGTLQEAGGIFWRDGSAWNFGRGQDPALPEFNYRKPVDYVSGASMAVRRAVWQEFGGFDGAFAPAYCEDADFAFRLRARGFEVVYQPQSELFHHEGFSHGRETTSGIKAHQVTNQHKLFDRWRGVLAAEHFDNGTNVFEARDRSRQRPHILVVDHYVPQWDRDAGSRTMWSYLRLLAQHGFQVTFWPDNLYEDPDYTRALQDIGIEVVYSAAYLDRFPKWFAERADHIRYVLFSRPHITEKYIDEVKRHRGVRILYYGHDLHYRRIESECRLDPNQRLRDALAEMKELEHGIIYKSDIALYPSHEEVAYLRSTLAPTARVELVPAYVFDEADLAAGAAAAERIVAMTGAELLFVGGFQHNPNVDGVVWFAKTVMPKLRAAGLGVRLNIVGSNITPEIAALAGTDIVVHGRLGDPELAALYGAVDLVVAPLRFGGGVKGKIIEAMAKGRPVATTSIGAQGIDDAATMLFLGDEPSDLAGAVLEALMDRAEAARRAGRALDFIRRRYTVDAVAAVFATFMPELAGQAERSRATP